MPGYGIILVSVIVVLLFSLIVLIFSRYKKCPSDKIMVIYGNVGINKDGTTRSARCIHGGASFVWPVIQAYAFLDLTPISINVDLRNALSKQNIRVDVPSRFTVGISTEPGVMQNAAERLLGLRLSDVQDLAMDIIFGQLRLVIATMEIEEINTDRDKFLEAVSHNVETELRKIGLRLINVNVTDITDESGYIVALGREAAAKAINDAKKIVAEKDRDGAIGEANAHRDQRIQVAGADSRAIQGENEARLAIAESNANLQNETRRITAEKDRDGAIGEANAHRDQRIQVAEADSRAIKGENEAQATIAVSNAQLREKQAEALKVAVSAEKIKEAQTQEASYAAQQIAELARAAREKATLEADIIVQTEIAKRKLELEAEAIAEQTRRKARGEADAIYAKMEAEARGIEEMLTKQAEGFSRIVGAAGGDPNDALRLMLADKMEQLISIQVEAIKNIKFDKVTVWDSGSGAGDGKTSTASFLSGLMKSVPPMNELFNMAGMQLPDFLGTDLEKPAQEEGSE